MGLVGACKTQHLPHPPAHTFLFLPPPSFGSPQLAPICASGCWLFWLYPQDSSSNTVPKSSLKPQEPQLPWDLLAPSSRKQTRHLSKYSPQNTRYLYPVSSGKGNLSLSGVTDRQILLFQALLSVPEHPGYLLWSQNRCL